MAEIDGSGVKLIAPYEIVPNACIVRFVEVELVCGCPREIHINIEPPDS